MEKKKGTLFIVATPIGNLGDITLRALEILKSVDLIACEDTRVTGKLLAHFNIKKPMVSYFQHSKLARVELLIEKLLDGQNIALVTDAGTPGISDPGQALIGKIRELSMINGQLSSNDQLNNVISNGNEKSHVQKDLSPLSPAAKGGFSSSLSDEAAHLRVDDEMARDDNKKSIKIVPIPGPSALVAAASVSGLIEKEFYFAGFLPKKKGRQTFFKNASLFRCPIVIYESALRLERTLIDIQKYWGDETEVFIAREMTKMFEEYWGGLVADVLKDLKNHPMKGEIVLVIKGKK